MNYKLYSYLLSFLFFSCNNTVQPIELSKNQLKKIHSIHETFEEVYPISIDETISNFKHDLNINKEINLWVQMQKTFITVNQEKGYDNLEQRKEVFKLILMRTIMSREELQNNLKLKLFKSHHPSYFINHPLNLTSSKNSFKIYPPTMKH